MRYKAGFTLIELSIVIVVIGLIIGGVLVGRILIKTSELHRVISKVESYSAALNSFKLKYNCLPGDCKDALAYFPVDTYGCPTNNINFTDTGAGTCNGDGDDVIGPPDFMTIWDGTASSNPIRENEVFRFWQQLSIAKLINGAFTGNRDFVSSTYTSSLEGVNIPQLMDRKVLFDSNMGVGVTLLNFHKMYDDLFIPKGISGWRAWVIGGNDNGIYNLYPVLAPSEAYYIDSKTDDGNGASGNVRAPYHPWDNVCIASNGDGTYPANISGVYENSDRIYYNIGVSFGKGCTLFIKAQF